MNKTHKYFCDLCPKKKNSDIFCSFDKARDYENHIESSKHLNYCKLIEEDSESILCKICKKKFSKKGYEIHKERNERLWNVLQLINNDYLTCNRFQWSKYDRHFNSFQAMIDHRSNPAVKSIAELKKYKISTLHHATNKHSYLKKFDDKNMDEKLNMIEEEEELYEDKWGERPQLLMCVLCEKYENEEKKYTIKHLNKWNMEECDCKEED